MYAFQIGWTYTQNRETVPAQKKSRIYVYIYININTRELSPMSKEKRIVTSLLLLSPSLCFTARIQVSSYLFPLSRYIENSRVRRTCPSAEGL